MSRGGVTVDRRELAARLALLATPGLPSARIIPLIETRGSAVAAIRALDEECGAGVAAAVRTDAVRERVRRALQAIATQQIRVIAFDDAEYPPLLRARLDTDAPALLFTIGDPALLSRPTIAIVGSRRASDYGKDVAAQISDAAARAGACVISGLALGIDAAAHEAALDAGGATIGVLGCGVDVYYPRRHMQLQDAIARAGLLLSELLPGEPPRAFQFPHRNRIIAALSACVVVVEATVQSGAISTATHAALQGVSVYGVPGRVDEPNVQGILALYRDGIAPFTGVRDLLEISGLLGLGDTLPPAAPDETRAGDPVWRALTTRARHIDAIARDAGVSAAEALTTLLQLELDGLVSQQPGGRFQRVRARNRRVASG